MCQALMRSPLKHKIFIHSQQTDFARTSNDKIVINDMTYVGQPTADKYSSQYAEVPEEKQIAKSIIDTLNKRQRMGQSFLKSESNPKRRSHPTKTLNLRGEKCTSGKKSTDCVTVLVACNQDGTKKLPLLVIGKYAKPMCFSHINTNLLPVTYESQTKA